MGFHTIRVQPWFLPLTYSASWRLNPKKCGDKSDKRDKTDGRS